MMETPKAKRSSNMEPENVSLRKDSQKAFSKAMTSIKKLIKVGKVKVPKEKSNTNERGVVLIRHVPHGFYEKQMDLFFNQFGKVTNVKLYRSHKTGRSLGYAFVEFKVKEVAPIVAETMNNYLMFTKLLKATVIENPGPKIFIGRKINETNCTGTIRRRREIQASNKKLSDDAVKERAKKGNNKLRKMQKKIKDLGVDMDIQVAGSIADQANTTANSSMVSVDFSSDEEISVRMRRKSVVDSINIPNKAKKGTKKITKGSTDSPLSKSAVKKPRKSLMKKRKSMV
ncbi:MKI67 FHA domain-interacting nucleolar phosphoprotein-like [Neocloeon triangulifer]|uniref:MKI67 FHA domain-interacting nucleolar phosphoprotein-like n=1 Tax=Neocloeon triangulifer TaxID=2078957 RepID=UPI00286F9B07|nr:MKI67 FHA domain-interacting nucleolar phosphoprotein-like [Neocloeon triangulifer]